MKKYHDKYIKYKTKYLELVTGGQNENNDIYYEIKGTYNGCSIILFAPNALYNWNNTENGDKPNFFKKLSELTTTFAYDPPESAASQVINPHQHSLIFPKSDEMDFESHIKKIYDILKQNDVKPPYILIGHSLSAFYALVFGKLYPTETKTVVLLDGTRHTESMLDYTKQRTIGSIFLNAKDDDKQEIIKQFVTIKTNSPEDTIELTFSIKNQVTLEKVKGWKGNEIETEIIKTFDKGSNKWHDKQIEILLSINNNIMHQKIINWDQVPDKLDGIKIVGLWAIWIANEKHNQKIPVEKKFDAQIGFLEGMKEYHEKLEKENQDNYDSYFFFGASHFLHHSNTDEVIDKIRKYLP